MKKAIGFLVASLFMLLCPLTAMAQCSDAETIDLLKNSYIVSADGTVTPVPATDIGGPKELKPGDMLVCGSVEFEKQREGTFNASCAYGNVANLTVYWNCQ